MFTIVGKVCVGQYEAEVLEVNPNILVVLVPRRMDLTETTELPLRVYEKDAHITYCGKFTYKVQEDRESP